MLDCVILFEVFTSSEEADQAEMELQKRFHTSKSVFTDLGDLVWGEDDAFVLLRYSMPRKISKRVIENIMKFRLKQQCASNPTLT